MRYYFFETCMKDRGNGLQPTLRAVHGQTFPDGTEVSTELNVQAPKEKDSAVHGARFDYPVGTIFGSSFLMETNKNGKVPFYTVYPNGEISNDIDFYPIQNDSDFKYVSDKHRSNKMNAAYVKFITFGDQSDEEEEEEQTKTAKKEPNPNGPFEKGGKARPAGPNWTPAYEDQFDTELELIALWMKKLLGNINLQTMAKRPKIDANTTQKIEELYRSGESIDTVTNTKRFNEVFANAKMDNMGLQAISKGPFEWYLDELLNEHRKGLDCTAQERNATNPTDVEDIAFVVAKQMDNNYGTTTDIKANKKILENVKKSIEIGWTANEILNPSVMNTSQDIESLSASLASGAIPPPVNQGGGNTLVSMILKDKTLACPKASEGFYVEKTDWLMLVRNLKVKKNTLLLGPSGSGKTEIVKLLCEKTKTPLTIIQMGGITEVTEQLIGKMDLDPSTGGTKFDWADFALAIQRPGVILLDEINRIPRNGFNALFSALDKTRTLSASGAKSSDVREIKVNPECCFFATANVGAEYSGTGEIDEAIRTRFQALKMKYLDVKTETNILKTAWGISEEDAKNISLICKNIRDEYKKGLLQHSVSTRESMNVAEMVKDGFDIEDALYYGIVQGYEEGITDNDPDSEMGRVKAIIASRFNKRTS